MRDQDRAAYSVAPLGEQPIFLSKMAGETPPVYTSIANVWWGERSTSSMNPVGHDRKNPLDAAALNAGQPTRAKVVSEESERRMRAAMQNSSDFVMILEADATIRYVSPAIKRVLDYRP